MTEQQHKYALLAKASYDNYFSGLEKTQQELDLYPQTRTFAVNTDLTNKNALVLVNPKEVVISYRGTDPKNVSDLTADAQILLGIDKIPIHFLDRFSDANNLYKKTKLEYPDRPIVLTGHSLGSTEAVYVGMKNGEESISFNEGASPFSTIFSQITGDPKHHKKQTVYLTGSDILSNFAGLQPYNIKYVPTKTFNFVAHNLSYFLPEPTSTPLPDWLLPKNKIPKYKTTKGINYAVTTLREIPKTNFPKKKRKLKGQLDQLDFELEQLVV